MNQRNDTCYICGNKPVEYHHLFPQVYQSNNDVIPLCHTCHKLIHLGTGNKNSTSELTKIGIRRAATRVIYTIVCDDLVRRTNDNT